MGIDNPWNLPIEDLRADFARAEDDLATLRGARILLTGGTGFLGRWLVSAVVHAHSFGGIDLSLDVVTRRDPSALPDGVAGVHFVTSDVRELECVSAYDFVIHGAASSTSTWGVGDGAPATLADVIVRGTSRVLEIAAASSARMLFLSSGAVYGEQIAPVSELAQSAPTLGDPRSIYGQAKRVAEALCACSRTEYSLPVVIARLFAFVGPLLPLDAHFAAGNFIGDALRGKTIDVAGDGTARRAYLYAGELASWCWALLVRGNGGSAYNVGSSDDVSIKELAELVGRLADPPVTVKVALPPGSGAASWYVPRVDKAFEELGLRASVPLPLAIEKTLNWYRNRGS